MHVTAAPDGPRMIGKLGLDPNELDRDPDGANMLSHLLVAKVAELIRFRMEHPRSSADVDASCEEEAAAA